MGLDDQDALGIASNPSAASPAPDSLLPGDWSGTVEGVLTLEGVLTVDGVLTAKGVLTVQAVPIQSERDNGCASSLEESRSTGFTQELLIDPMRREQRGCHAAYSLSACCFGQQQIDNEGTTGNGFDDVTLPLDGPNKYNVDDGTDEQAAAAKQIAAEQELTTDEEGEEQEEDEEDEEVSWILPYRSKSE